MEWITASLFENPYMATALGCVFLLSGVVFKVKDRRLRIAATAVLLTIASASLVVGLIVQAKQDLF